MLEQKLHIDENRQLSIEEFWHSATRRDALLLDVRAPIEFDRGSIPGAMSICLFDNAERATIGTLWRGQGHDVALQQGYDFLNESQPKLMEKINSLDPDKQIYVYCAKGGLRSKIACNLIRTFGKTPIQLIGGYRRFREYCTESFEALDNDNVTFISLNGLAGSGKTLILDQLQNSLNLEKCAAHSGSAFGHIGMEPASTKEFEANLLDNLYDIDTSKPIFVEAESRRIGKLSIPKPIWQKMVTAKQIEIFADLDVRIQRMIDLYIIDSPDALIELKNATLKLKRYYSNEAFIVLMDCLQQKNYVRLWELLLSNHYDPSYQKSIDRKDSVNRISGKDPQQAAQQLAAEYL